jgi:hypothetical protein
MFSYSGLNPRLKHALNQATDIVTKNLAQRFINLRGWQFAPKHL